MNVAVDDGSDIAELMQYFKDNSDTNNKFAKLSNRVNYFKYERAGVNIMATLFEEYLTEE